MGAVDMGEGRQGGRERGRDEVLSETHMHMHMHMNTYTLSLSVAHTSDVG